MGSGVSVTDGVMNFETADGVKPMKRTGLSLESVDSWTPSDVSLAVSAANSTMHSVLGPPIERFEIDGAFILSVKEEDLQELLFKKMKLEDDVAGWATRSVLRLQKRKSIVGRERRLGPLPKGYKALPSRSRPGELSYLVEETRVRTRIRPIHEAPDHDDLPKLPKGWLELPSKRWPGKLVYMHPDRPNMHLGWRPEALSDSSVLEDPKKLEKATVGIRRALERVAMPGEVPLQRPELLLKPRSPPTGKTRPKNTVNGS